MGTTLGGLLFQTWPLDQKQHELTGVGLGLVRSKSQAPEPAF